MKTTLIALFLCGVLPSCVLTRSSHVVVGTVRSPIAESSVRVYMRPPAKFEEVAILSADSRHDLVSSQKLMDATMQRMKREAAALGANGVLLQGVGDKPIGTNTSGFGSASYNNGYMVGSGFGSTSIREAKAASGIAIYVTKE